MTDATMLPESPARPPDFQDDFSNGPRPAFWVDHYLPHWTTPERSEARYDVTATGLQLRIDADQPEWRQEDSPLRVSSLQTGTFSGALGTSRGFSRHREDGLVVRTETPTRLLWTPSAGRIDVTVSATLDSGCMTAAWLNGTEHRDAGESGEICIFEIDASAIGPTTTARCGVKAHWDPRLKTDMTEVEVPLDATRPHTWTAIWGKGETLIGCEGVVVRRIAQAPVYPQFLMLALFEIDPPSGSYPKRAALHRVRGWTDSPS